MRKIKFRAWDKSLKEFRRDGLLLNIDGRGIASSNPEHYVLMQYTGDVDKNNKEIYEGDKVKYATGDPDRPFIIEDVYFAGGAFYPICTQPSKTFEVIGNIYETGVEDEL